MAAEEIQMLEGEGVLDSFGDHPQAEVAAQVDGGMHDHL
jgi:hypothetical protein